MAAAARMEKGERRTEGGEEGADAEFKQLTTREGGVQREALRVRSAKWVVVILGFRHGAMVAFWVGRSTASWLRALLRSIGLQTSGLGLWACPFVPGFVVV